MSAGSERISVVIVAADSGDDLTECVERTVASSVDVEVIVSDNASVDGSVDRLALGYERDSRVHILRNGTNLGFGAGCNRAAALANDGAILILNPDCRVEPETVAALHAVLTSDDRIGVVGATIVDQAGRYERASRRYDPYIRRALMTMSGLDRFSSRSRFFTGANMSNVPGTAPIEDVEAISGALILIRRTVFEQIGGFDEGYFLHCEDLDLCRRVRDTGARVVCANHIRVVHRKGTSSRARPIFVARYKHRGMWRWFNKFDPASRNPVVRELVRFGLWAHLALVRARFSMTPQR